MPVSAFSGSLNSANWRQALVASGNAFVFTNPTPGTGVVCGTVTAASATADGLFTISNGNGAGGRSIYLDTLSLNMSGTAPTATTVMKMDAFLEAAITAPSAGNVAITPKSLNPTAGQATGATVNAFSAAMCTIPAAVGARSLVANWSIPTGLGITGDTYTMLFGGDPASLSPTTAVRSTTATNIVTACPSLAIPPGYTLILNWWWLTQATNGPTFEYQCTYFEY
jgi:hypothetical protein